MTAGYELTEPEPTLENMLDVAHHRQVPKMIFLYRRAKLLYESTARSLSSDTSFYVLLEVSYFFTGCRSIGFHF